MKHQDLQIRKCISTLSFAVLFSFTGQAQFLERLADKAVNSAERTVERKVEQKSRKETEKAFDSTFNRKKTSKKSDKKSSSAQSNKSPRAVYQFTHKYVMQLQSGKYNTTINYYLSKGESYLGSTIESASTMTTVMDFEKKTMFMYTEAGNSKMLMATSLNFNQILDKADSESDARIKKSGKTKTILGYPCEEYLITSSDMKGYVWVTQSADVSFPNEFYNISNKKQATNQQWMTQVNGLVLDMQVTDTSKRKPETITMRCVALEEQDVTINSKEYKKLM
ncbi:DUF4412 domain-containing protein [Mangrovimonas spongiae]|uniref:DUF4412 domain-containing protein n=1 Tax=Mangrovimonas spongiae TaxID=2494697 RepID=A0A3R9UU88_9FLAO|nr:DUF4412 domain-containing protein [Mangrovimonas spongiae]RSK40260.1 DUF4412 domain-containing protein [Mangrovimonas spongiae]